MTDDYDEVIIEIGTKGQLTRRNAITAAARVYTAVCLANKKAGITLLLGGYDNDPRELWEIPEAIEYVREFATSLNILCPEEELKSIAKRMSDDSLTWQQIIDLRND